MGMVLTGGSCRGPKPARGWGRVDHHGHSGACGEPGRGGSKLRQHVAVPSQGVSPRIEKEKKRGRREQPLTERWLRELLQRDAMIAGSSVVSASGGRGGLCLGSGPEADAFLLDDDALKCGEDRVR